MRNIPDHPMLLDKLSIVVPLYNEAANVSELCRLVIASLESVPEMDFEIVLVDDGSRDPSWDSVCRLHESEPRIKGLRLSRNFGHQAALTAGYDYASGDAIISMDSDLQHPPELIPLMVEKWRDGFDVVSMIREEAPHEGFFKKTTSKLFYRFMNALSDIKINNAGADFRLIDRKVLRRLRSMRERARFLRGLISWIGFKETEILYRPSPRFAGKTKYSLAKMLHLATNGISSFSTVPLKLSFYLGIAVTLVCVFLMGYAIYNNIFETKDLTAWASTFMTMLFLNGVQLIMLGIIGLYLGRVFEEVKKRPLYIAREEIGIARKRPTIKKAAIAGSGASHSTSAF